MKVVVIIVTYKGMRWYQRCFDSLRESIIPLQTIVIDNDSGDETVEYIKNNYPELHLVESGDNLGFGKANNIGFKYAIEQDADYVFLLNQDAWVKPDTIEKLVEKMNEAPEYGIVSPMHLDGSYKMLEFGFEQYINRIACPELVSDFIINGKPYDRIYPIEFVNAAMWLISMECIKTVGGFAPSFPHYGEDVNYVQRSVFHKLKIGIYPLAYGVHDRENGANISKSKNRYKKVIGSLTLLNNINSSLMRCINRFIFYISTDTLKLLLSFSLIEVLYNMLIVCKIIFLIPTVCKERKITKNKGLNFL